MVRVTLTKKLGDYQTVTSSELGAWDWIHFSGPDIFGSPPAVEKAFGSGFQLIARMIVFGDGYLYYSCGNAAPPIAYFRELVVEAVAEEESGGGEHA